MKHLYRFVFILVSTFFMFSASYSQKHESKLMVQYIYKFAKNINWEKASLTDTFYFAYLGNNQDFISFYKRTENKNMHGLPVKILIYDKVNSIDMSRLHLIFIDNEYSSDHLPLFKKIEKKNILLVSDNFDQQKLVMINFTVDNQNMSFEVNKKTIIDQKLEVTPKLLLLGGKEIDIRELYKKQEKELDKERERVEQQKKEIAQLNKDINAKLAELVEKSKIVKEKEEELKKQLIQLKAQEKRLAVINKEVKSSKTLLTEKIKDLKVKENEINTQKELIAEQNKKVEKAKEELSGVNKEIAEKQAELQIKEQEIADKEVLLGVKDSTINTQKIWMLVGGIVLLIILTLSGLLAKMIRDRNRSNKMLEEKNSEINSQKEEIMSQKEQIEEQYNETKASIRYAKNIQSAILPEENEISKYFDNMVLFKPKDIVSGDFYWFTHLPANEEHTAKTFAAAVDCTGHGVPGAFMSLIGNRFLKEIVSEKKITDTALILEELHKSIRDSLKQVTTRNRDGMDLCICKIEQLKDNKYEVSFSGAKRPVYFYNTETGKLEKHEGNRKSIGGSVHRNSDKDNFTKQKIQANPNDIIYLTTDGYLDQNNANRKRFGAENFESLVGEIANKNFEEQKEILNNVLNKHMESTTQRDDITIIGIKL